MLQPGYTRPISKKETRAEINKKKKQNKRMFIIILVVLGMWFATIGYLIYVLNDIGVETTTTTETVDIDDVDNIEHSHIHN